MIDIICKDIQNAIDAKAYISALALALTLPDWCGKAEYPNDGVSSRYKKWYSENIGNYETFEGNTHPYLSADVVYSLRNNLLHQGTLDYDNKDVRQEQNIVDKFILCVRNEMYGACSSIFTNDKRESRTFEVNILNLIMKLRLCASAYYEENKEKFDFINLTIVEKGLSNAFF